MKDFLEKLFAIFFVLCIVFIPFNFDGKVFQFEITKFLFQDFIQFIQNIFFENSLKNIDFSSDTIALNLLIAILFLISVVLVFLVRIKPLQYIKIIKISRTIVVYYLAFILLKYGFDKIFKSQFYLPEPNILYSKFGDLSRDILYWSTIGTSRFYSISLGIIEVFTAVLLLVSKTRTLGSILAIGVFTNVILVNFGFDISVKTFSILLLLMSIFAIFPNLSVLFDFFILKKQVLLSATNFHFIKQKPWQLGIKFFIIGLIFIQVLLPYFEFKNFNDDEFQRPFLHGSYKVISSNQPRSNFKISHFYIHRKNYLILENDSGERIDFYFELEHVQKTLKLINYQSKIQKISYNYNQKDSVLILNFPNFKIKSKAQNWRKSKALKNDFHWTIDEIR